MHLKNIENRQEAEKHFHDRKYAGEKRKNYYDLGFKSIIFNRLVSKLGNIEDKKVLEFGCGEGWFTKILAAKGAEVWAFDISDEAVIKNIAKMETFDFKYEVHVNQMTAEKLAYEDDMFDLIVGNAILHHTELDASIKEIKRVLKKNGKAFFLEPLGHNPLLNLYRKLTPHLRSRDEVPLKIHDFSIFESSFPRFEHEEYYLTAIFALFFYFFRSEKLMLKTRDFLHIIDSQILSLFPDARKYCWYSILCMQK
jgi:ubiquinone/menaquinone biosynthesis C-methylase UbiE